MLPTNTKIKSLDAYKRVNAERSENEPEAIE
jgi:hypothetical protein